MEGMRQKIQTVASVLLILFMPFMQYIDIAGTKVNISLADVLLPVLGILMLFNIKELFQRKRWLVVLYFAGLIFSLALSQFAGRYKPDFLHVSNTVMLMEMLKTSVVAMYFFSAFLLVDEKNFRVSLITLSLGSILVMIIGFSSYIYSILGKDFFIEAYTHESLRFRGTFEDPNLCALYFLVVFFITLFNFQVINNRVLKIILALIGLLSILCIVLTQSRGGWLAFAGAVLIFLIFNLKHIKKESLIMIGITVVFILAAINMDYWIQAGKVTNLIISRIQETSNMETAEIDRVQLMKAAFQMGNDNFFFGVGKGSFPLNSNKYVGDDARVYLSQNIPHNTIFGIYAQQGILGLLVFISLPGFLLYQMIKSRKQQNVYLIPVFIGLFLHSMSINIENVRFAWYILGIMLISQQKVPEIKLNSEVALKKSAFALSISLLSCATLVLFAGIATKMVIPIYPANGRDYEKHFTGLEPGNYFVSFDIQTDKSEHQVEIYDGAELIRKMNFKSAYGLVSEPISIQDKVTVVFKSNSAGWMKVKNAYLEKDHRKIPLYDYILLPEAIQNRLNDKGYLTYLEEPSFKKDVDDTGSPLAGTALQNVRIIRHSNLSHVFEFDYLCEKVFDINYQLDLLLEYPSIFSLLPDETQKNHKSHRFTLSPVTTKWEEDKSYTPKTTRLMHGEDFNLFGRYYDYANKIYFTEAYFPIPYHLVFENQQILSPGESNWINLRYSKDKENNIHITNNGWVETGRFSLSPGEHKLVLTAQGFYLDGYSEIRIRDSYLKEVTTITLDGLMKEYTVNYYTASEQKGISFILELINYISEKDVGNRKVLLKDTFYIE